MTTLETVLIEEYTTPLTSQGVDQGKLEVFLTDVAANMTAYGDDETGEFTYSVTDFNRTFEQVQKLQDDVEILQLDLNQLVGF